MSEIAVAVIHGFEFAAVDGDDRLGEEIEVAAKYNELPADTANGFTIVSAKVGNRFEVRRQSACQPHQLDITLGLTLKPAAGLNSVEIAVDVDF
ncbi:hypothetical protein D3C79_781700 [compost metagenome]